MPRRIYVLSTLFALGCSLALAAGPKKSAAKTAPAKNKQTAHSGASAKAKPGATKGHSVASSHSKTTTQKGVKTRYSQAVNYGRRTPAQPRRYGPSVPTAERYQEIQKALAEKGFYKGEANGEWGPESVDALKSFQRNQNLDTDGKINSLSLIALGLGPKRALAAKTDPGIEKPYPTTPEQPQ